MNTGLFYHPFGLHVLAFAFSCDIKYVPSYYICKKAIPFNKQGVVQSNSILLKLKKGLKI
jgi:hypothetical protein